MQTKQQYVTLASLRYSLKQHKKRLSQAIAATEAAPTVFKIAAGMANIQQAENRITIAEKQLAHGHCYCCGAKLAKK